MLVLSFAAGKRRFSSDRRTGPGSSGFLASDGFRPLRPALTAAERIIRRDRIWQAVADIPRGKVSTYGDIARAAGVPRGARQVGRALQSCPPQLAIPWHRVIAAGGRIALPGERGREQRQRLECEDVPFAGSRVRLDLCRWNVPEA